MEILFGTLIICLTILLVIGSLVLLTFMTYMLIFLFNSIYNQHIDFQRVRENKKQLIKNRPIRTTRRTDGNINIT